MTAELVRRWLGEAHTKPVQGLSTPSLGVGCCS
jgi:hypothetical protein